VILVAFIAKASYPACFRSEPADALQMIRIDSAKRRRAARVAADVRRW
jgi:hypothetical protein